LRKIKTGRRSATCEQDAIAASSFGISASTVKTLPVILRPPSPRRNSTVRATSSASRSALRTGDTLARFVGEALRQFGNETGRDRIHRDAQLADYA
jgi:hypothetical protein